jgi:DNA repair protein RecN (Recombination protein N)
MLRFLGVRHLAVIDELDVEFEPGLNVLTGETGAGKTVLVGAIELLVGGRASADLVRTGEASATVQAIFEDAAGRETVVRREVSAEGRSRAFIDDALVTVAALRETGRALVDLHGQHEHQTLLDPAEHRAHLDAYLAHDDLVAEVAAAFDGWRAAVGALEHSRLDEGEKKRRFEQASFDFEEIGKVAPRAGEDEDLATERSILASADRLSRLSSEAYAALYDGEGNALATLAAVWKRVGDLAAIDDRFRPYLDERAGLKSALEDLAAFLRAYVASLETSPERLQAVEDRLAALGRLTRRYGPTLDDVLRRHQELREEIADLGAGEEHVARRVAAEEQRRRTYADRAAALSQARRDGGARLGRALEAALAELAMPKSRVVVDVRAAAGPGQWARHGVDDVELLLSSNPGEEPRSLARIVSGGELSRVMLGLRALVKPHGPGRTLVFDEVDAGIGGVAADAVGARLGALGRSHQVICITHLPQIAARPAAHFQISKRVRGGRTVATLTRLDSAGREMEIARMIGGAAVSPRVLASARELIDVRSSGEIMAKAKVGLAGQAKAKGRPGGA